MSVSVKYKIQCGSVWNRFKLVGCVDLSATDEASMSLVATSPFSGVTQTIKWAIYWTLK
jgi:hypothetical protein